MSEGKLVNKVCWILGCICLFVCLFVCSILPPCLSASGKGGQACQRGLLVAFVYLLFVVLLFVCLLVCVLCLFVVFAFLFNLHVPPPLVSKG